MIVVKPGDTLFSNYGMDYCGRVDPCDSTAASRVWFWAIELQQVCQLSV